MEGPTNGSRGFADLRHANRTGVRLVAGSDRLWPKFWTRVVADHTSWLIMGMLGDVSAVVIVRI
jgi:hypothetical protein